MRYKHLKRKINEHLEDLSISNVQQPDRPLFDVDNPKSLERINIYLGMLNKGEFQDPRQILTSVRAKLNLLGLDFNYTGRQELGETETFEVKQYGDVTTVDPSSGAIKKDDAKKLKLIVKTQHNSENASDVGQQIIMMKLENPNASSDAQKDSNDLLKGNKNT